MMQVYKHDDLGHVRNYWLESRHHFSFGEYRDPARMGFGTLRVINDDLIRAGTGFDFHPHRDMEIITYVREGTVIHRDSLGNEGRTAAGDVQVMSAGTGIVHAEHADPDTDTKLFQIWIIPEERGVAPRWEQAAFPRERVDGALRLLVSGRAADAGKGALYIHQDAAIYGGRLAAGSRVTHRPAGGKAYALISGGSATVNGQPLSEGDGAELSGEDAITIQAGDTDAEILVIEV